MQNLSEATAMVNFHNHSQANIRGRQVFVQYSKHTELKTDQAHPHKVGSTSHTALHVTSFPVAEFSKLYSLMWSHEPRAWVMMPRTTPRMIRSDENYTHMDLFVELCVLVICMREIKWIVSAGLTFIIDHFDRFSSKWRSFNLSNEVVHFHQRW